QCFGGMPADMAVVLVKRISRIRSMSCPSLIVELRLLRHLDQTLCRHHESSLHPYQHLNSFCKRNERGNFQMLTDITSHIKRSYAEAKAKSTIRVWKASLHRCFRQ